MITNRKGIGRTQKAKRSKSRQMKRAINRLVPNLPKNQQAKPNSQTAEQPSGSCGAEGFGAQ